MSKIKNFIRAHIEVYLRISRNHAVDKKLNFAASSEETSHIPPTAEEVENLIIYLQSKGVDPVIVGSSAVAQHLKITEREMSNRSFRLTQDFDVFISKELPQPPSGWRRDLRSIGLISWISPSGGYVDFLVAGHRFPDNHINPKSLQVEAKSMEAGCPVADIAALFQLKLNSFREKDLFDLVALARKVGIPKDIYRTRLNKTQQDNLDLVELWVKNRPSDDWS